MITELNPYSSTWWSREFPKRYPDIATAHECVYSYQQMALQRVFRGDNCYAYGRSFLRDYNIVDAQPYYYIDYLRANNPDIIADLGCGINPFRGQIPGVVGVDNDPDSGYDIFDTVDPEFVLGHTDLYPAIISINMLHFAPITELRSRLEWIVAMLRPGGRAFVSVNLETLLMYTDSSVLENLWGPGAGLHTILPWIDREFDQLGVSWLVRDWPILHTVETAGIRDDLNGNIRMVFQR